MPQALYHGSAPRLTICSSGSLLLLFIGLLASKLRHHHADLAFFCAAAGNYAADLAAAQNKYPVAQLEQHVEILADVYDGDALLLLAVNKIVYRVGRIDIKSAHGIGREQHRRSRGYLASDEHLLNIAAGETAHRSAYAGSYDLKLDDDSFTANSGEILGIAGISGCGQKELLEAIAGLQPIESGSISYIEDDGTHEELIGKDPLAIAEMGVALSFVPEDRLGMGLVGSMDLADNMMLRSFRKGRGIFTDRKSPRKLAENVVEELEVSTPGISTPVRRLSGGNVQKVLVGREIASAPTVLLTAYAVRGLDINSSYTIYDLINKQKKAGVAVIYVGEDLDVLLELADRILVLCGGKVSGIISGRGAKKRDVGMMMTKLGGDNANE